MSSPKHHLKFFDDLIMNDGRQKLWNEFFASDAGENGVMSYDIDAGTRCYLEVLLPDGEPGCLITEDFSLDFLLPRIELEINHALVSVNNYLLENSILKNRAYSHALSCVIDSFLSKSKTKLSGIEAEFFNKNIIQIKAHLKSYTIDPPKIKNVKVVKSFGIKAEKKALLENLYCELNRIQPNGFIDQERNTAKEFVAILLSKDLPIETKSIHLACEVKQAAFIFKNLKWISSKFTIANIARSLKFIKPSGEHITQNDINSPNSRSPQCTEAETIKKIIERFRIKYT